MYMFVNQNTGLMVSCKKVSTRTVTLIITVITADRIFKQSEDSQMQNNSNIIFLPFV